MTTTELKQIWQPGSKVQTWSEVRPEWPNEKVRLYGPGTDSGTFDYFTKVINGKEQASRADFTASEDDNSLVQGIAGDLYSLGYFGYAHYKENQDKLNIVAIDLRFLIVTLKVNNDLERMGDQVLNIAEEIIFMEEGEVVRHQEVADTYSSLS